jgi:peptidyl-prolyl cis-trans isomerase SurA
MTTGWSRSGVAILAGSTIQRGSPDVTLRRPIAFAHASALAVALMLAASIWPAGPAAAGEVLFDAIAAQVGSGVVLLSEVNQLASPVEVRMRKAGVPEDEILKMRADVLDRLIEARLIENVVRRLELDASDADVDLAIESIASEAGLTVDQLYESVASHGLTVDEYREKIRSEIERSKVINTMVRSRVHIEPLEVESLYYERFSNQPAGGEEVHVRHILVASAPQTARSTQEACQIVEGGAERIRDGSADFATVASEISDVNPGRGGDMGWIHSRDLAGWMAPVVDDLEPGQLSAVIETQFGCNLLQLVDRRKFEPITFEKAKPQLEAILMREKMEEEYSKWVESLRSQTYIEKKSGFFLGDAS